MPIPGSNIRTLRREAGLSVRALAKEAGIDHGNLSKLEQGEVGYSRDVMERIAKVLDVSLGVLFADPGVVEAAALGMRKAPLLSAQQLAAWQGPDEFEADEEQTYLYLPLHKSSRYVFALLAENKWNAPFIQPGDEMIFDANGKAVHGSFVVAQDAVGGLHVGRLHAEGGSKSHPQFEIIPIANFDGCVGQRNTDGLRLRGTLVELRRNGDALKG